jgi:hypothetical protein
MKSHVDKHLGEAKRIYTVSIALETCQSSPRTRWGKLYIHQGTLNSGNWASKQKKYIHHPAVTDIHWPSDLFPSIKFPEKQSLPQMESLISYITLPTNSIFLLARRKSTVPQPGPLDIWASGSSLDTQQEGSREQASPWDLGFVKRLEQMKPTALLCLSYPSHPYGPPFFLTGASQIYPLPETAKNLSFCPIFLARITQW